MVPEGWREVRLSEVAERVAVGLATSVTEAYAEKGVPIIRNQNIKKGYFDGTAMLYLDPEFSALHPNKRVKAGDVITVHTGSKVGLSCVVPAKFNNAQTFTTLIVTPKSNVLSGDFLSLVLNSEYGAYQALRLVVGGGKGNFNTKDFKLYPLLLPSYSEQLEIVEISAGIGGAIARVEAFIGNARAQKRGLMQQLLTGKRRLPGFEGEWREERISDVSQRILRKAGDGHYPVLMISSRIGFLRQNQKYSRYMAGKSVDNYILLNKGEFAYNKGNSKTYEFGCVFPLEEYQEGLVPHVYVCIKLADECDHDFYKYLFEFDYLKRQLGRVVNTGVRNNGLLNIRPEEFLKAKVPVPPINEQKAIAAVIRAADAEIENLESQLEALKEQKKALMQQLLTGKRRVKVYKEAV